MKTLTHKNKIPIFELMCYFGALAGLVFMPSLIKTAGQTIWGKDKTAEGTSGGLGEGDDAEHESY